MAVEDVRCIYHEGAGCYGRNGHEDAAGDAAVLAKVVGKPVRVQWSRADEHGWEPMGPPTLIDVRAKMDAGGNIHAWDSEFFVPQGMPGSTPLVGQDLADLPSTFVMAPGNVIRNSAIPYKIPNVRTVCHRLETTPFRPSWIRAPGRMQNTYANECFLDEPAAEAKIDPLEFRLNYLDDKRGIELLERLALLAKWEKRSSPKNDRCGNIMQTVSRTLVEEVKFDRAMSTSLDWATYPILTFPDIPEIIIELIDRPNERPWGTGEPATAIVPSAISNAVFDAAGIRLRSVPYTPDKMKAALEQISG